MTRNFIIKHLKDSTYSIKIRGRSIKNGQSDKFNFSHFFGRTLINNNAILVYKNEKEVVLIREYKSRMTMQDCIVMTIREWQRLVDYTDKKNFDDITSLAYLLDKFFDCEFLK